MTFSLIDLGFMVWDPQVPYVHANHAIIDMKFMENI